MRSTRSIRAVTAIATAVLGILLSILVVGVPLALADLSSAPMYLFAFPLDFAKALVDVPQGAIPYGMLIVVTVVLAMTTAGRNSSSVLLNVAAAILASALTAVVWIASGERGEVASELNGGLVSTSLRLIAGALLASLIASKVTSRLGVRSRARREGAALRQ